MACLFQRKEDMRDWIQCTLRQQAAAMFVIGWIQMKKAGLECDADRLSCIVCRQVRDIFRKNTRISIRGACSFCFDSQHYNSIKQRVSKHPTNSQFRHANTETFVGHQFLKNCLRVEAMLQTHKSLLSMQQSVPSYLIRYIECGVQGHEGEKVNLICLGDKCQETSLICSLCAATSHHGHPYKPLKIYLDELYRNYKGNNSAYERDLADLDRRRDVLLLHLRACVERLAQEFMQLQDDILGTYESIRNQIHQNEARRNKFEQFYLSMIKDNYGDPFFEVKNYLFREELHTLSDQDIFQGIASKLAEQLKSVRANFKGNFRVESKIEQPKEEVNKDAKVAFLRPPCITNVGDLFSQTNLAINSPNFCLFDSQIGDWSAKLRVQVMSLQPGAKLTFGLIRKDDFLKANYLLKEETASMWLDSLGKHKGDQYSHITAISVNHIIDFFVKKQNFRVTCKNNNALFNLTDKKWCFFFALEGNCQIKITYPYNK